MFLYKGFCTNILRFVLAAVCVLQIDIKLLLSEVLFVFNSSYWVDRDLSNLDTAAGYLLEVCVCVYVCVRTLQDQMP